MSMSHTTVTPSKPQIDERVPDSTIAYFKTRNKLKAFTLVHKEFERSGITKADLAKRLGKGADRISHILAAPGNWTLDTVSELLFAISGAEPTYGLAYPLDKAPRNQRKPEWLEAPPLKPVSMAVGAATGATGPTLVSVRVSGEKLPNQTTSTSSPRTIVEVVDG